MKKENGLGNLEQKRLLNIVATLTIDTRKKKNVDGEKLPVCVRVSQNRKSVYIRTGLLVTLSEWDDLIASTGRGASNENSLWAKRKKQVSRFNKIYKTIEELSDDGRFSLSLLVKQVKNKDGDKGFLEFWENVASTKKIGTSENYRIAAKCFEKLVGNVSFKDIKEELIKEWEEAMEKNGYSSTTIGIYMRACRVVVNEAIKKKLIDVRDYPFGKGKMEIKKGSTRKEEYLSVSYMKQLYSFSEQEIPVSWSKGYAFAVLRSVATFLAAYLGNGMNLADLARLEYSDYYFTTGKSFFRFLRTKTKDKAENQSEVIVPIIPELRALIEKYGSKEKRGCRVFGYILEELTDENLIRKRIAQENSNIKDRLEVVFKLLDMPQRPSMTWARHSFASNLTHAEVPERYISQAMGHSTSKNVTALYISEFPHEKMLRYNSFLLNEKENANENHSQVGVYEELKKMPKGELLSMFAELMK